MKKIKGVLIDLGGVVYQGDAPIAGSAEAIRHLKDSGRSVRFLTNTTSQPRGRILTKLQGLGVPVDDADVFTPSLAARAYLTRHDLTPHFLMQPALMADFQELPAGRKPAVVVADARDGFTYESLNDAFRRLEAGAVFIALAGNRYYRDADGELSLDAGAFVAALEYAAGVKAVVLGKPAAAFFHAAVDDMGLQPEQVAMIGDDAEFDVLAAMRAGLTGCLVRTGKWQPGRTAGLESEPDGTFDDLAQAVAAIIGG